MPTGPLTEGELENPEFFKEFSKFYKQMASSWDVIRIEQKKGKAAAYTAYAEGWRKARNVIRDWAKTTLVGGHLKEQKPDDARDRLYFAWRGLQVTDRNIRLEQVCQSILASWDKVAEQCVMGVGDIQFELSKSVLVDRLAEFDRSQNINTKDYGEPFTDTNPPPVKKDE